MVKKIISALVVVAIFVAVFPFPKHISKTLYTTGDELTTVILDLWQLNYLLADNKLFGSVSVATPFNSVRYGENLNFRGLTPEDAREDQLYWFDGYRYDADANTMYPVQVYLTQKFDRVMICETVNGILRTQLAGRRNADAIDLHSFFAPYLPV